MREFLDLFWFMMTLGTFIAWAVTGDNDWAFMALFAQGMYIFGRIDGRLEQCREQ